MAMNSCFESLKLLVILTCNKASQTIKLILKKSNGVFMKKILFAVMTMIFSASLFAQETVTFNKKNIC